LIKFAKRAAGIIALAVAALAVPAGVANASTPQSICGSRYTEYLGDLSITGGDVYLYYNASNGYYCAVNIKSSHVGTATLTGVFLSKTSTSRQIEDVGNYSSFAGPVYLYAPNTCVWAGGETSTSGGWQEDLGCA
jgi:hypothetical protein